VQTIKIAEGLFKILIPFEELTTTVYLYVCENGAAIIDSATYASDVDKYIVPAVNELNIQKDAVKYLLFTHNHGDHSGGMKRLQAVFNGARIGTSFPVEYSDRLELTDGKTVLGNLKAVHLPGHTEHAFGFYDTETKTLLSGDCLQLAGVGKYIYGIGNREQYIASVNKLKKMDIEKIVAAHEYVPLGSTADGKKAVLEYLNKCIEIAQG
jgi:glyoxylase-like metal-dependent hydrolase (beta-lactamase superfamily II)